MAQFVVIVRAERGVGWQVAGPPVDTPAEAKAMVDQQLATRAGAKAAVCAVLRTFTSTASASEDADPKVDA